MIEQVIWSPRAEKEFAAILGYLAEKWNKEITNRFIDEVDDSIDTILRFPEIFPIAEKKKKVRKCVVNAYVCLYYHIDPRSLQIVAIFDSRQDPAKLNL